MKKTAAQPTVRRGGCGHGLWSLACLIVAALLPACARLQLPAIDPNGSRIFLPLPNTTQLALPRLHGDSSILPTPAYTSPALPPPCVDGGTGGFCNLLDRKHKAGERIKSHFASPGKAGEILMTPLRVVAPVGGEVVLLAGICGRDGYLVNRQPIEWMLSPDSVGTFIEVGDDSPGRLTSLLTHKGPKVEKLDVDFARGRTSNKETLITRGSPECNDDIALQEGQTWLSISSPSEGVSRVTVLAPESEVWDQRRQTATIYWVDAQWEFPAPVAGASTEIIPLITRVTKAENLVPAEGWRVKYTILDPSVAVFNTNPPSAGNEIYIPVNSDGQAIANLIPGPAGRGTTPVQIDVIRPADPSDNLPELRLGTGHTMVTFSAPGLSLLASGPSIGAPGQQLTYTASLGNPGDIAVENTRLTLFIPDGWSVVGTPIPEPLKTTSYLRWDQGPLPPGRQLDVQVVLQAGRANSYQVVFEASGEPGLSDTKEIRTDIVEATVQARFAPVGGIAQAEVGDTVRYEIDVTNTSRQAISDIELSIEADPGLLEAREMSNIVKQYVPILRPGETHEVDIEFQVQQQGQQQATLNVSSGGRLLAQESVSILGLEPRRPVPDIGVSIAFPEAIRVGARNQATITLRNPGQTKLSDIRVQLTFDNALRLEEVDTVNMRPERISVSDDRRTAVWTPSDLLPPADANSGDPVWMLTLGFDALFAVERGTITAVATATENVRAEATTTFRAVSQPVAPPPAATPPPATRSGSWRIALYEQGDPWLVGQPMRYSLTVTNGQNQEDRNVQVQVLLSQGVELTQVTSLGNNVPFTTAPNGTVSFPSVNYVRPGEQLSYTVVVTPLVAQTMVLQARVFSDAQQTEVVVSEETTVNLRP